MSVLKRLEIPYDRDHAEWVFWCPGCGHAHSYVVQWGPLQLDARKDRLKKLGRELSPAPTWIWNGSMITPSFHPSLLYQSHRSDGKRWCCHLFLTNGKIHYLADCTHALAGTTVQMEDF